MAGARQVTQADFAISELISGVNMRLTRGGIREMHWHLAAEWGFVTEGTCRITTIDDQGRARRRLRRRAAVLPFGPAALAARHRRRRLEFILCFDDGKATEYNTLLVTDWIAHTPPDILAANFGVPAETFANIPLHDLYIFQGQMPGPLAADQQAAAGSAGRMPISSTFALGSMPPTRQTKGGEVRIADSRNFPASRTIAAALVTVHPGGLREMHWHPNADEWQYYIKGQAEMTVFNTGPQVVTQNFRPGDIGYVKRSLGHFISNTGDSDLQFLEVFNSAYFSDVSLSDWLAHTPPLMVAQHLNIDPQVVSRFPDNKPEIMPA